MEALECLEIIALKLQEVSDFLIGHIQVSTFSLSSANTNIFSGNLHQTIERHNYT